MPEERPRRGGELAVGAGIFLSRVTGLVRESAIANYLGQGPTAGALRAALRIPNLLQNLLGEGVLSASFIPVYARLRAEGKHAEAVRVAHAIGTLLALVAATVALLGVVAARPIVDVLAPGFPEHSRELTIGLVRILFPGVALLVMSAWCLGVLNSHGKFFLSYVSPVLSNTAMIACAIGAGRALSGHYDDIATWLAYGAVIGAGAQFVVQLPSVIALLGGLRPSLAVRDDGVRATLRTFGPILVSRGSVQISSYIDQVLASYLGDTIVAAIANASVLALLPVSLFGMAVSAAELPAMSSITGDDTERAAQLRVRLAAALRRVVFLVVPSAVAFVAIGDRIIALLFQHGAFGPDATRIVWIILAGSALGLSAGTQGRVLNSAFYAIEGHALTAVRRARARRDHRRHRLPRRDASPRCVRLRAGVGRVRPDRERGVRGVGRVPAAAPLARREDRPRHHPGPPRLRRARGRDRRRRRGVRRRARRARRVAAHDVRRRRRVRRVRPDLPRHHDRREGAGGPRHHASPASTRLIVYTRVGMPRSATTRVFWSGGSQAVRLPKALRLTSDEVTVRRRGDALVIEPIADDWSGFWDRLLPLAKPVRRWKTRRAERRRPV